MADQPPVKSVAVTLPVFEKGSFAAFKVKFAGYCTLMAVSDQDKLGILPMCFPGKKFDSIWEAIDGRSTVNSVLDRLEAFIRQEDRPADPLLHLTSRDWLSHETAFDFVRELRRRAGFITGHKEAIDDLVKLQIARCLPESAKPIVSLSESVDKLAQQLATMPRPSDAVVNAAVSQQHGGTITCFNCEGRGHTVRFCRKDKTRCDKCGKFGHLRKFCRSTSTQPKNVLTGPSP